MSLGIQATLHRSDDQGTSYGDYITDIVGDMTAPEVTAEAVDNNTYGQAGVFNEFEYGMLDGGSVSFAALHKTGQTDIEALETAQRNREKVYLQIRMPLSDTVTKTLNFKAVVTKVHDQIPKGDRMTRQVDLKVSGEPVPGTLQE